MVDAVLRVRVRAALASYLLRQWLVDCSTDHQLTGTEYRLWLRNSPILYGVANAHWRPDIRGSTHSGLNSAAVTLTNASKFDAGPRVG
jgi:hypothetical protein